MATTDSDDEQYGAIVVIEDEPAILDVVAYNLERAGYAIHSAGDGVAGLDLIRSAVPDLVVLDIMLPGIDGLDICRELRADELVRGIPVLMLTALGDEGDIVAGFEAGADDYLAKPFSPRELVARVGAILRRAPSTVPTGSDRDHDHIIGLASGAVRVDPHRYDVTIDGENVAFTRTEHRILVALAGTPDRALTREQIVVRTIGDDAWVTERTIDVHVRSIRRKLGDYGYLVETVRGMGYRIGRDEQEV